MKISELKKLIESGQVRLKKSLGQNYLVDRNHLIKIKNQISLLKENHPKSLILEIGCGLGMLTEHLLEIGSLIGVEIDERNCQFLRKKYANHLVNRVSEMGAQKRTGFYLLCLDALKLDFKTLLESEQKIILVGNLPYHLIYKIILFFLENHFSYLSEMVFLVQKEAAERIHSHGTRNPIKQKNYGIPSILIQYHCHLQKLWEVPPSAFYPPPKVKSEFIGLAPKAMLEELDYSLFKHLVKASFQNRRKNLINSIKSYLPFKFDLVKIATALSELGFADNQRGEDLSLEDYLKLAKNYLSLS